MDGTRELTKANNADVWSSEDQADQFISLIKQWNGQPVIEFTDSTDYSLLSSLAEDDSKEIIIYISTYADYESLRVRIKLRPPCIFVRDTRVDGNGDITSQSDVFSQYYVIGSGERADTYSFLLINTIPEANAIYSATYCYDEFVDNDETYLSQIQILNSSDTYEEYSVDGIGCEITDIQYSITYTSCTDSGLCVFDALVFEQHVTVDLTFETDCQDFMDLERFSNENKVLMSWTLVDEFDSYKVLSAGQFMYIFITCSNIISSSYDYSSWSSTGSSTFFAYTALEATPIQTEAVSLLLNGEDIDNPYISEADSVTEFYLSSWYEQCSANSMFTVSCTVTETDSSTQVYDQPLQMDIVSAIAYIDVNNSGEFIVVISLNSEQCGESSYTYEMTCSVDTNPSLSTSAQHLFNSAIEDYATNSQMQCTNLQQPNVEAQDDYVYQITIHLDCFVAYFDVVQPTGITFGTKKGEIVGEQTYPVDIEAQLVYFYVDDAQSIGAHILESSFTNDSLSKFFTAYSELGSHDNPISDYQYYERVTFGVWFIECNDESLSELVSLRDVNNVQHASFGTDGFTWTNYELQYQYSVSEVRNTPYDFCVKFGVFSEDVYSEVIEFGVTLYSPCMNMTRFVDIPYGVLDFTIEGLEEQEVYHGLFCAYDDITYSSCDVNYNLQDKDSEVVISYVSNYNRYGGTSGAYDSTGSNSICGQMEFKLDETDFQYFSIELWSGWERPYITIHGNTTNTPNFVQEISLSVSFMDHSDGEELSLTFTVTNLNCQEYIVPDYASEPTKYRLQDAEQEELSFPVNQDFTSDDQQCVDLADYNHNEIVTVILIDSTSNRISKDQEFLEYLGMELQYDTDEILDQLVLSNVENESLDGNSIEIGIRRTRGTISKILIFQIEFELPSCTITQSDIDNKIGQTDLTLYVDAEVSQSPIEFSYTTFYELAEEAFQINSGVQTFCGNFVTPYLSTDYNFVYNDYANQTIFLLPELDQEAGIFEDTQLIFSMDREPETYRIQVQIVSNITRCELTSIGFKTRSVSLTYWIGDSNFFYQLPEIVQEPDCGYIFEDYDMVIVESTFLYTQALETLHLMNVQRVIHIETSDFSLLGESLTLQISPVSGLIQDATLEHLTFSIKFSTTGAQFLDIITPEALTCDIIDEEWSLQIPKIQYEDQVKATVKLDPRKSRNRLFEIDIEGKVVIAQNIREIFLEGMLCPPNGWYAVTFLLESSVVGNSQIDIRIPIDAEVDQRFDLSSLEGDQGQWIPEGIERPVIQQNDAINYYDGIVQIRFPSEFVVPSNWQDFSQTQRGLFKQNVLEIIVPPVLQQTQEDVGFNWSIKDFTSSMVELKLNFTHPYKISAEQEPNFAKVYFLRSEMFTRQSDYVNVDRDTSIEFELLPQLPPNQYKTVKNLAEATVKSTSILYVALLLAQSGLLNQILSQISSLSIITHLLLIPVQISGFVLVFYGYIFEIVRFDPLEDILHFDYLVAQIFKFKDKPISLQADALGYTSHYTITNVSAIFVYFVISAFVLLLITIIIKIGQLLGLGDSCPLKYLQTKVSKIKWNGMIQFFNEIYLCLSISIFINFYDISEAFRFDTAANTFNSIFTSVLAISLILVPCIILYALTRHWGPKVDDSNYYKFQHENSNDELTILDRHAIKWGIQKHHEHKKKVLETERRFGILVMDYWREKRDQTNPSRILITKVAMNFIRWLLLAFIIIKLDDWVWLQVMLCMYLNQAFTMFTMYNILYEEKSRNVISNINEVIILLTIYHLFCFTDFVPEAETRASFVGLTLVGLSFINLGVNLLPLAFKALKRGMLKLRIVYAKINKIKKKRQAKQIKRKRDRLIQEYEREKEILKQMLLEGQITSEFYQERIQFHKDRIIELGPITIDQQEEIYSNHQNVELNAQQYENQLRWADEEQEGQNDRDIPNPLRANSKQQRKSKIKLQQKAKSNKKLSLRKQQKSPRKSIQNQKQIQSFTKSARGQETPKYQSTLIQELYILNDGERWKQGKDKNTYASKQQERQIFSTAETKLDKIEEEQDFYEYRQQSYLDKKKSRQHVTQQKSNYAQMPNELCLDLGKQQDDSLVDRIVGDSGISHERRTIEDIILEQQELYHKLKENEEREKNLSKQQKRRDLLKSENYALQ